MKQDRAALEDREVSIGQPRHLAEGLVREMLGIPNAKWHALDAIGQPGLFQCPTHTYVTHIAPRRLGNPIEGGENQVDHSASPSVDADRAGWTAADAFKKSEIPCRTGKASLVLGAWIGNSWEQGSCRNEPEPLNPRSRHLSKLGQTPSGGMTCRLYWHITMTTSSCSTCRRRCSRAAWLNTRRPGICSSPITNLGKPSTSKSYKCASETPSPLRSPSCVAGRPQSVALPCRLASSFG